MKKVWELLKDRPREVFGVLPEQSVLSAAQLMRYKNFGTVPVLRNNKLLGVVSERDMLNKVLAPGLDPRDVFVSQIMSRNVATVSPENTLEEALGKMRAAHCRHLPVIKDGNLIGMISLRDLLGVDEVALLDTYLFNRAARQEALVD